MDIDIEQIEELQAWLVEIMNDNKQCDEIRKEADGWCAELEGYKSDAANIADFHSLHPELCSKKWFQPVKCECE